MLLQVKHEDGTKETISITGPVEITEGLNLNRIHTADGMDHFFTKEGEYDGWGRKMSGFGLTEKEVNSKIADIERHRYIHDAS